MGPFKLPECAEIAGQRVLFVMAVAAEYGPHLQARFAPLITGVGPVEAALHTGIALHALEQRGALPRLLISLGSAGSRRCELGQVYQVTSVSWRDMDASRLGFTKGVTPFLDHPVDLPLYAPLDMPSARLSTGANIVGGEDYATIDADMVDMETFAVLRACMGFDVPLIALRGISDGDQELGGMHDWTEYLHVVDENLATAVRAMTVALETGGLAALR